MPPAEPGPAPRIILTLPPEVRCSFANEDIFKRIFFWVGIVLVAAFLAPVLVPDLDGATSLEFVNLTGLGAEGATGLMKFWLIYPLIAGLVVIPTTLVARRLVRPLVLLALGLIPIFLMMGSGHFHRLAGGERLLMDPTEGVASRFSSAFVCVGFAGLLTGALARYIRPRNGIAGVVGAVAGVLYLVSLVVPTGAGGLRTVPLTMPVEITRGGHMVGEFEEPGAFSFLLVFMGVVVGVSMLLFIVASVLCIVEATDKSSSGSRAGIAHRFWVWSIGALASIAVVMLFVGVKGAPGGSAGQALFVGLFALLKAVLMTCGIFLLAPFAGADLLVAIADRGRG